MSQATTWGVPQSAPASPGQYAARDQDSLNALMTLHSGATRPTYLTSGLWLSTAGSPTACLLYYFDGTDNILLGTLNISANTFSPAGGILNNFAATTAPTVNDDAADGYVVGSQWINTVTGLHYVIVVTTVGAAVWKQTADTATAQTLTGKTINGASNTLTVRLASDVTGALPIVNGGTGATTATAARVALGAQAAVLSVVPVAAAYNQTATDDLIIADAHTAAFAITMLSASANTGKTVRIKKALSDTTFNIVTITGVTTLNTLGEEVVLYSDGTNWVVLERYIPSVWTAFVPTINPASGSITNATKNGFWRRVGDSIEVKNQLVFTATSATFGNALAVLPGALAIDLTKIPTVFQQQIVGYGSAVDIGVQTYPIAVDINSSTQVQAYPMAAGGTYVTSASTIVTNLVPFTWGAGDALEINYSVPITGWNG